MTSFKVQILTLLAAVTVVRGQGFDITTHRKMWCNHGTDQVPKMPACNSPSFVYCCVFENYPLENPKLLDGFPVSRVCLRDRAFITGSCTVSDGKGGVLMGTDGLPYNGWGACC
ncbi:hypothetical protein C8035_v010433 [Colletotrichum spinosum]|uniref:Secreted protein n=1 Tax=Colletotrichum spinosum TaxID=1347390 RepID=A0A4R8PNX7_9PEZI|nr:hypothetical protein C8035_v010433 [Colletotrichum spinosum]